MPRPEILSDLPSAALQGGEVVSISMTDVPPVGPLLKALGEFIISAESQGLTTAHSYGRVTLHLPPTPEQLEEKLRDAQASWDHRRSLYEAATVSGTRPEDYTGAAIEQWAAKESLPLPWSSR